MSVYVDCHNCGYRGTSKFFSFENVTVSMSDVRQSCPRCGGIADVRSGTYDFVGTVMAAFRESTKDQIKNFHDIVEAVSSGKSTVEQADRQVAELGSAIAKVWNWTNSNSGALSLLLTVLGLIVSFYQMWDADQTTEKLQATVDRQIQVEQMILAELDKHGRVEQVNNAPLRPTTLMQTQAQRQMRGIGSQTNRHERRKAKAKARKEGRTS